MSLSSVRPTAPARPAERVAPAPTAPSAPPVRGPDVTVELGPELSGPAGIGARLRDCRAFDLLDDRRRQARGELAVARRALDERTAQHAPIRAAARALLTALASGEPLEAPPLARPTRDEGGGFWLDDALDAFHLLAGGEGEPERAIARASTSLAAPDGGRAPLFLALGALRARLGAAGRCAVAALAAQRPDGGELDPAVIPLLDAHARGAFDPAARGAIEALVEGWTAAIAGSPGRAERELRRWSTALGGLCNGVPEELFPALRTAAGESWPAVATALRAAALPDGVERWCAALDAEAVEGAWGEAPRGGAPTAAPFPTPAAAASTRGPVGTPTRAAAAATLATASAAASTTEGTAASASAGGSAGGLEGAPADASTDAAAGTSLLPLPRTTPHGSPFAPPPAAPWDSPRTTPRAMPRVTPNAPLPAVPLAGRDAALAAALGSRHAALDAALDAALASLVDAPDAEEAALAARVRDAHARLRGPAGDDGPGQAPDADRDAAGPVPGAALDGAVDDVAHATPGTRREAAPDAVRDADRDAARDGSAPTSSAAGPRSAELSSAPFGQWLATIAMAPARVGASPALRRWAVRRARSWILGAFDLLAEEARANPARDVAVALDGWRGRLADPDGGSALVQSLDVTMRRRGAASELAVRPPHGSGMLLAAGVLLVALGAGLRARGGGLALAGVAAIAGWWMARLTHGHRRERARAAAAMAHARAVAALRTVAEEWAAVRRDLAAGVARMPAARERLRRMLSR